MKKIKFFLSIGYSNAVQEEEVEYPDDVTEEEIKEDYQEWKNGIIDGNWWEVQR